ncbi:hypothetical protein FGO68_gene12914 [Halteria grandinella]|uniref:Uncharacterized protein n=1 Tax=Halteria grandinella TaxID=5974 RepID=A0A8J8T2Z5_HALGN|nr:hypothetical protein FGO68_gene12914 [Halteria grandinella]
MQSCVTFLQYLKMKAYTSNDKSHERLRENPYQLATTVNQMRLNQIITTLNTSSLETPHKSSQLLDSSAFNSDAQIRQRFNMGVSIHKQKAQSRLLPELYRSPEMGIYVDKQQFLRKFNASTEKATVQKVSRNDDIRHSLQKLKPLQTVTEGQTSQQSPQRSEVRQSSIEKLLPLFARKNIEIKRSLNVMEKESIQLKHTRYLEEKRRYLNQLKDRVNQIDDQIAQELNEEPIIVNQLPLKNHKIQKTFYGEDYLTTNEVSRIGLLSNGRNSLNNDTSLMNSIIKDQSLHERSIQNHSRNQEATASAIYATNQSHIVRRSKQLNKQMTKLISDFQALDKQEDFSSFLKRKHDRKSNLSISFDGTSSNVKSLERKLCRSEFMSYPVAQDAQEGIEINEKDKVDIEVLKIKDELMKCMDSNERLKAIRDIEKRYQTQGNFLVVSYIQQNLNTLLDLKNETTQAFHQRASISKLQVFLFRKNIQAKSQPKRRYKDPSIQQETEGKIQNSFSRELYPAQMARLRHLLKRDQNAYNFEVLK